VEPFPAKPAKPVSVRRSQRLLLTVRVVVCGKQLSGLSFTEEAVTRVVNAHGALILMKQLVSVGDRLVLKNVKTKEEVSCSAVDTGEGRDHRCVVGVEFDQPSPRFWRVLALSPSSSTFAFRSADSIRRFDSFFFPAYSPSRGFHAVTPPRLAQNSES